MTGIRHVSDRIEPTPGAGGLPRLELTHPSGGRAEVYLHGAHVTSWVDRAPDRGGRERLFVSERATFREGTPIRGGIPVVFPQFADTGPLPMHGIVRAREWSVVRAARSSATLGIRADRETRALWPQSFRAELAVTLAETTLTVALTVANTDATPWSFTAALHTYFATDDICATRVVGLAGRTYRDKVRGGAETLDTDPAVTITAETDRVYVGAPSVLRLEGGAGSGALGLETDGFGDWVVWNPWAERARAFADMAPKEYRRMLCVEAARIGEPVRLAPGERWTGTQVLRVLEDEQ